MPPRTGVKYDQKVEKVVKPVATCWPLPMTPGEVSTSPASGVPVILPYGRGYWMLNQLAVVRRDKV